jgi:hypothetical protein
MSDEKLEDQLFWKVDDDVKEGHTKENSEKKKEFREV